MYYTFYKYYKRIFSYYFNNIFFSLTALLYTV